MRVGRSRSCVRGGWSGARASQTGMRSRPIMTVSGNGRGYLSPAVLEHHHRRLAHVLEAEGQADPEVLAFHFHGAGESQTAGEYYDLAAQRAAGALAFDRGPRSIVGRSTSANG